MTASGARLAYVVSQYPAVSHAFLQHEVATLRALGATVETFSIRETAADQLLTDEDRRAFETTYSIIPPRWDDLTSAHLRAALTRPRGYARALSTALRMRRPGPRGFLWALFYLAEAGLLWDRCRRLGVHHVHAQFASNATDVALLAAELGGTGWTWSFTVHGPVEFYDVPGFRLPDKARSASFVACTSDYARSQVQAFLSPEEWPSVESAPLGIDAEAFRPPERPEPEASDRMRILTVGRLAGVKGQAVLLDAVAELAARGVAVELTIVGEGEERERLERRAGELGIVANVEFLGAVGQDRIAELYGATDVFCTSSFAEGVPTVLMEAMASGLPTVATRIMGIPELVEDGVTGLLVRPGRADQLADALGRLAADPGERRRMGEAGRRKVVEERDERQAGELLLELLARWTA